MTRWGNITVEIDFIGNHDQTPVYAGILRQVEQMQSAKRVKNKGTSSNSMSTSRKITVGGSSSGAGARSSGSGATQGPLTPTVWKQA